MPKKHLTPHDHFFRAMMTNPKIIKQFFQKHLPTNIKAALDFSSIKPQKDSFIDDKLKLQITDLLYAAEFNQQPGYFYLLIEHQSTPLKLMPFRVLKYMLAVMEYHLDRTKQERLPIIYTARTQVFHVGTNRPEQFEFMRGVEK